MQFFAPSCDVVFRKTKSPFPHWLLAAGLGIGINDSTPKSRCRSVRDVGARWLLQQSVPRRFFFLQSNGRCDDSRSVARDSSDQDPVIQIFEAQTKNYLPCLSAGKWRARNLSRTVPRARKCRSFRLNPWPKGDPAACYFDECFSRWCVQAGRW